MIVQLSMTDHETWSLFLRGWVVGGVNIIVKADYKCVKIYRVAVLDMMSWLKERNICKGFGPSNE